MKDLRQRVAELERKLAEVLTLVSNNNERPQKILAPPMTNFGASSAGIKKICKPLATGASFYKLGDKSISVGFKQLTHSFRRAFDLAERG